MTTPALPTARPSRAWLPRLWLALGSLWHTIDALRRALLNLLLLGLIVLLAWLWLRPGPAIEPGTALVLAPQGRLVEQAAGASTRQRVMRAAQGQGQPAQTRVRDLVAALDAAAADARIPHVLLMLDDFGGGGLPALREVGLAIERFKASGKPVFAWASGYDQAGWFLAAHASEVWMHPEGLLIVDGFGRRRSHYRTLLDQLGVEAHVLRAGRYKNAMEPYSASRPSAETLESEGAVWRTLWASYTGTVERVRGLPAGSIARSIDALPASLAAADGNGARWALGERWVDRLVTRETLREELQKRGHKDASGTTFRQIGLGGYLAQIEPAKGDAVGVIVAQGPIGDGTAGPGAVGGLSTAALVRQAREDKSIKAVVLRVDSPGGSAFGSELVRRELELTREAGKPVVVSMGSLAASGGYWISMAADEIIADEATITGSIGVVGLLPSAAPAMARWGVNAEGVTTTWLRDAADPRLPLDPRVRTLVQTLIDGAYRQFVALVAQARGKTTAQIEAVAQGRVWGGRDALEQGLVDRLGSLGDAAASAARRAGLEDDRPRLRYIEQPPGRLAQLADRLGLQAAIAATAAGADQAAGLDARHPAPEAGALPALALWAQPFTAELAELQALLQLSQPAGSGRDATGRLRHGVPAPLAHCLCGSE